MNIDFNLYLGSCPEHKPREPDDYLTTRVYSLARKILEGFALVMANIFSLGLINLIGAVRREYSPVFGPKVITPFDRVPQEILSNLEELFGGKSVIDSLPMIQKVIDADFTPELDMPESVMRGIDYQGSPIFVFKVKLFGNLNEDPYLGSDEFEQRAQTLAFATEDSLDAARTELRNRRRSELQTRTSTFRLEPQFTNMCELSWVVRGQCDREGGHPFFWDYQVTDNDTGDILRTEDYNPIPQFQLLISGGIAEDANGNRWVLA